LISQQDPLWNSFMHFCKANDGCCGEQFKLKRLTDAEQKTLDQLNSVFSKLSIDEKAVVHPQANNEEKLKKIKERLAKLELLIKPM
jgi:anion-transporting  ArsA/GET3 family ATPase